MIDRKLISRILVITIILSVFQTFVFASSKREINNDVTTASTGSVLFSSDFESETVQSDVAGKKNGWGWDVNRTGSAEDVTKLETESRDSISVSDHGSGSNALRYSNGDTWYKNNWLTLSAEDAVTSYGGDTSELANDLTVSFKARFQTQGISGGGHEEYIRLKGAKQQSIAEISVLDGKLRLVALNSEKNENVAYDIKDLNIATDKGTDTDWHEYKFELDMANNSYRLTIDNTVFTGTPFGEWIPASDTSGVTSPAAGSSIGKFDSIEFGNFWSGWWQCIYVDDMQIESKTSSTEPTATINPTSEPTEEPIETEEPTSEPTIIPSGDPIKSSVLYINEFETDTVESDVKDKANGWGWDVNRTGTSEEVATLETQTRDSIVVSDHGSGSNALRYSNGDTWYKNNWLTLSAEDAVKFYGGDTNELSNDLTISFKARFQTQGISGGEHEEYIRLKGAEQQSIAEISVLDGKLRLVALNSEKNENIAYDIKDLNIVTDKGTDTDWHEYKFELDMANNSYRLTVDNTVFTGTPFGEWIPASDTSGVTSPAAGSRIGKFDSIEFGNFWSGWWQCIYVDDMKIKSKTGTAEPTESPEPTSKPTAEPIQTTEPTEEPTAEPTEEPIETMGPTEEPIETTEPTEEPTSEPAPTVPADYFLYENFESGNVENDVINKKNGWGWDKASEVAEDPVFRVSDNERPGNTKTLLFSNGDCWYKNMWLTYNPADAYIAKAEDSGISETEAKETSDRVLKNDLTLSLKSILEIQGVSGAGHEAYIRVKGADNQVIAELAQEDGVLSLIALNEDLDQNIKYYIKDIDVSQGTMDAQNIELDLNFESNRFRLRINGEVFTGTPFGEWIPAGTQSGIIASEPHEIGSLNSIEFGHFWSGWYQCIYLDDIGIYEVENGFGDLPTSPPQPTQGPVQTGTKYSENFEDTKILDTILNQDFGWSFGCSDGQDASVEITKTTGAKGGSAIKLSSSDWYKTMHIAVDLLQNGIKKQTDSGKTVEEATSYVNDYLSSDEKLSMKVKFSIGDISTTNIQYIRLDALDGHGIMYLYVENTVNSSLLKLYALNEDKNSIDIYTIKDLKADNTSQSWHDIEVYLNHDKNAYMLSVDGTIFNNNPHGKWIPAPSTANKGSAVVAPIGAIGTLTYGHSYSGWDQEIIVDDIMISDYEKIKEVYEVREITIQKENGGSQITPNSAVKAKIYTDGGETDQSKTIQNWMYTVDGATWIKMDSNIVPSDAKKIKVDVTCTSIKGETASNYIIADVLDTTEIQYISKYQETFDDTNLQDSIRNQQNGWMIDGSTSQVDVGSFVSKRSLRFAALSSGGNGYLKLDLSKQGYDVNSPKTCVKFPFAFGLSGEAEVPATNAIYYFNICDTAGNVMTSLTLMGDTLYLIYYDEAEGKNCSLQLAKGKAQVIDRWRNAEFYFDSDVNRYSLFIDGKSVGPDNNKWIQAGTNTIIGKGQPNDFSGVGSIMIGYQNASWWGTTMMGALDVMFYEMPTSESSKFNISDLKIQNTYGADVPITNGCEVNTSFVVNNGECANHKDTWSYITLANSTWTVMDTTTVPSNATKLKVDVQATDMYGINSNAVAEVDVLNSDIPIVANLKINGDMQIGGVLTADYDFVSSSVTLGTDMSSITWYKTNDISKGFTKIKNATGKTYTLTESDVGGFIKVEVTPIDEFGVRGVVQEKMKAYSVKAEVEAALSLLEINAHPKVGIEQLVFPSVDPMFGYTLTYKSNDTSIISNTGSINRPDYGINKVQITVTATAPDGTTVSEVKNITIDGKKGKYKPSEGSSGGGGGGGGSGGGNIGGGSTINIDTPNVDNTGNVKPESPLFDDVNVGDWFYDSVYDLLNKGIISKDTSFRPESSITRAEFTKLIIEMLGLNDTTAEAQYSDLSTDFWGYSYIASAKKFGIVNGIGNDMFGPEDNITREDMAVIIDRVLILMGIEIEDVNPNFSDNNQISDYAILSVGRIQSVGIIEGFEGMFSPKDDASRAESSKIISVVLKIIEEK